MFTSKGARLALILIFAIPLSMIEERVVVGDGIQDPIIAKSKGSATKVKSHKRIAVFYVRKLLQR